MATNKVSANQKYWEKRRALEDQYRLVQEQATLKKLTDDILPNALKEIQKQLAAQADLHNITMDELLADFSNRDQKKYREYVEKNYKALMNSDDKYQEFIDEFFPDYDYAKVNRLLQIRTDIFDVFAREMIKKDANKVFNDRLEDILQRTYSSNSRALARIMSVDVPNKLSQSELNSILNYPWSGKTFSNRLWGNVSKLEQNLSAAIVKSISSGQGVIEALKTMRQDSEICDMFKLESSKFKKALDNLVRTEYASFAQQGIAKSYEATGVEEYDVLTSEDEKVCTICGGVEKGNPYKLKDAVIGVNRGPFHGRCRCTDIPHIPDLPASIDKEYEAMFGDLLDEFAKDQFGIRVNNKNNSKSDLYNPKSIAKQLLDRAQRAEPQITEDLVDIAKMTDTKLAGTRFRLKTLESLTRKVSQEPTAKMRDVVRFTAISDVENMVKDVNAFIAELDKRGYTVSAVKNYWINPSNPYNGINANFITPKNYEFELQFHTKESFDLKNGPLHEVYEKFRVLDPLSPEAAKLKNEMDQLSKSLERPQNIDKVKGV